MSAESYQPTDRRPLASRELRTWQRVANALAERRVSPNGISVAGMFVGIIAGLLLGATNLVQDDWAQRATWLAAAGCIQLRLLANMLDGMVAVASNRASALGELYNEIPDRVSDVAIIIGAGYSTGGVPSLGYVAATVAVLTAYVRAVGKAAGASNLFVGPMAKPHRMFALTMISLLMSILPNGWRPTWGKEPAGLAAVGLAVIVVGGLITIIRRVMRIVKHLKSLP